MLKNQNHHICYFYENESENLEVLKKYFQEGFHRGHKLLYYSNKSEKFLSALKADDSFKNLLDQGSFLVLRASEVYYPNGKFVPLEMINRIQNQLMEAKSEGFKGVTLAGEMSWSIEIKTPEHLLATYEYELRKLFDQQSDLWAYCMYDQNVFNGSHKSMQCVCHPVIGNGFEFKENPLFVDFSASDAQKLSTFLKFVPDHFSGIRQLRGKNAMFVNDLLWETDKKIIKELAKHNEGSEEFKQLLEARLIVDGHREELTFREKLM